MKSPYQDPAVTGGRRACGRPPAGGQGMNTPKRKGTRAELVAELAGLSLRRVRRIVDGKLVMVTLINLPDEYPHQPTNKGGEA